MLATEQQQKIIRELLKKQQNFLCADCDGKSPCWASLDFGVFVCLNCSGAHRALGPSITRVKSTRLDTWNQDWLLNMQIGNSKLNQYWQFQLGKNDASIKPTVNSSLEDIIKFVREKYVSKRYANPKQTEDPLKKRKNAMARNQKEFTQTLQTKSAIVPNNRTNIQKQKNIQTIKENLTKKIIDNTSFAAFDMIFANKKKTDNLISFQETKANRSNFNDFRFEKTKKHEPRYNRNQFHSTSDIEMKRKHHDLLQDPYELKQPIIANNQSINLPNEKTLDFTIKQHSNRIGSSIMTPVIQDHPPYDRNIYSTMSSGVQTNHIINTPMMGHHYSQTPNKVNYVNKAYNHQNSWMQSMNGNNQPFNRGVAYSMEKIPNNLKITLETNINLQKLQQKPKQQPSKSTANPISWVDEWK